MVVVKVANPPVCLDLKVRGVNQPGVIKPVGINCQINILSAGAVRAADSPLKNGIRYQESRKWDDL
jgi:hypothetical protein